MGMTAGIQTAIDIVADITGDATAGNSYVVSRAGRVLDAHVIATATNGGGTITVGKAGNAITNAITCAVDQALTRATTLNDANYAFSVGDSLRFTAAGAADRGIVVVKYGVARSDVLVVA